MKKIITMTAIAFIAFASHAAAVGWQCAGATAYAGGDYSVFVIGLNGVTGVDQIVSLAKGGSDYSSYQFASGTVAANGTAITMASSTAAGSITYSGSGTDSYTAFIIVMNEAGTAGSYTATTAITMDNNSTSKTFAFANQANNFASNTFKVETADVPEPTSGLLLLLGVAGLALRRRRA